MNYAVELKTRHESPEEISRVLNECLDQQRQAQLKAGSPSFEERRKDLTTLKTMVNENREAIVEAICQDYGNRSRQESLFAEIVSVTDAINDMSKRLKKWMKPQKRHIDLMMFAGGKNRVIPQPLGVVGIIVPWNFPINLSLIPVATAFAAGNRAMVKMSENSIALTRLLIEIVPKYFSQDKLAVFEETGGVGIEFSKLPYDLLMFTGSGQTGRSVMASAAPNLTPVILELGGKAPAVVDPNYPMEKAVQRLMYAKQYNAGQICTNVDYVFIHETQVEDFITHARAYNEKHCADIESVDYTSIIDDRSFKRLMDTLDDAREKGARIINLNSTQEANSESRKIPIHLVLDTTEEMTIRQRETFGPLLMVLTYKEAQDVIDYVNGRDRPLAFYPFSNDKKLVQHYIDMIMSGGVTVNDAVFHVAQHDIPFGGVGASGMGHYHGYEGFLSFSKLRPVFYQAPMNILPLLAPPYSKFAHWMYDFMVKLKS